MTEPYSPSDMNTGNARSLICATSVYRVLCLPHVFLLWSAIAVAQNLVPNPSFEERLLCPDFQSQLDRTAFWFDPSEDGTPDYYHECNGGLYSVPNSTVGFQQSVQGKAYVGIFLWIENVLTDWREYIEVELMSELQAGECYRFHMYANLADFSGRTTDALGVHFYPDSVLRNDPYPPGEVPHLALSSGTYLDREEWTVLEGEYTAAGGERFLMIGNYEWNAQTSTEVVPGGPANTGNFVYCLVDSVTLTPCVQTSIQDPFLSDNEEPIIVNVQDGRIVMHGSMGANAVYSITDQMGKQVAQGACSDQFISTARFVPGIYFLEVRSRSTLNHRQRIFIP
ncbi:MAG: hypothetical protein KA408_00305 [Flavobacteriales bacterium]|nr:hypothetical protein [Flavobacteriales bacterium]